MKRSARNTSIRNGTRILAALIASISSPAFAAIIAHGPYLVYPGKPSEMTILWQTDDTPKTCAIAWGEGSKLGNPVPVKETGKRISHLFSYTITGLKPGSGTVRYRITADDDSVESAFTVAPDPKTPRTVFYAYGDTRSNTKNHAAVAAAILKDIDAGPKTRQTILLHSGDFVAHGARADDWDKQFFTHQYKSLVELFERMPLAPCKGNHDGSSKELRERFPCSFASDKGFYYSFDYGPVHFSVIELLSEDQKFAVDSDQYRWLASDLEKTDEKWKVVLFHAPTYGTGDDGPAHEDNLKVRDTLVPLLEKYTVSAVINGHNHMYLRREINGIQYMTLGGGGAPLYRVLDKIKGKVPGYRASASAHHFARFDVSGNTMAVTIIDVSGKPIDHFEIVRGPDKDAPDVVSVQAAADDPTTLVINFSEPVQSGSGKSGAENVKNYQIANNKVVSATLSEDGRAVTLMLKNPLVSKRRYTLRVKKIADRCDTPNRIHGSLTLRFTVEESATVKAAD